MQEVVIPEEAFAPSIHYFSLNLIGGIAQNVATDQLPPEWETYRWVAWPVAVVFPVAGIVLRILLWRAEQQERKEETTPSGPVIQQVALGSNIAQAGPGGMASISVTYIHTETDRRIEVEGNTLGNLGNWGTPTSSEGRPSKLSNTTNKRWRLRARSATSVTRAPGLGSLGNAYAVLGQTQQASEYHAQALAIFEEIGSPSPKDVGEGHPPFSPREACVVSYVCLPVGREERCPMTHRFTLEYWMDEGWYVGRLKQVPGVFSQGRTLEELEENIRNAYRLMLEAEEEELPRANVQRKELVLEM